ncbi:MAG: hypothetical protein EXR79_10270 [Myxococcales bacterium]|nr:hypothetical protein [Myxococcales bacterium]
MSSLPQADVERWVATWQAAAAGEWQPEVGRWAALAVELHAYSHAIEAVLLRILRVVEGGEPWGPPDSQSCGLWVKKPVGRARPMRVQQLGGLSVRGIFRVHPRAIVAIHRP